jgi:hypothetical protein
VGLPHAGIAVTLNCLWQEIFMHFDEFQENVNSKLEEIDAALERASKELNLMEMPLGIGPLRLNSNEITNIVIATIGMVIRPEAELTPAEKIEQDIQIEGVEELATQLFLYQYPQTFEELDQAFHRDIVKVLNHNDGLMPILMPMIKHLKLPTRGNIDRHNKYRKLIDLADDALQALDDSNYDHPAYVYRIVDEIADFADVFVPEERAIPKPVPANDNVAAISAY